MHLTQALTYDKNNNVIVGGVDFGGVIRCEGDYHFEVNTTTEEKQGGLEETELANKLLCFLLSGLKKRYRFPVAYYFVKALDGDELHKLTLHVIREVENLGFKIVRIVAERSTTYKKNNYCDQCDSSQESMYTLPILKGKR